MLLSPHFQAVFGNPADILPSNKAVTIGMPTLNAGNAAGEDREEEGSTGVAGRTKVPRHSSALEEAGSSSEEEGGEEESDAHGDDDNEEEEADGRAATDPEARRYDRKDPLTGAPEPLAPDFVTLSLLPRSQWQSLVHLEAIKARNRSVATQSICL